MRGQGEPAVMLARRAIELNAGVNPVDEGCGLHALGEGLALLGEHGEADLCFEQASDILERQHQWRDATSACRSWAKMLREIGREEKAMDVLERAAELATRVTPAVQATR
jgi:tetratricopeptide (TPR) repeat protein